MIWTGKQCTGAKKKRAWKHKNVSHYFTGWRNKVCFCVKAAAVRWWAYDKRVKVRRLHSLWCKVERGYRSCSLPFINTLFQVCSLVRTILQSETELEPRRPVDTNIFKLNRTFSVNVCECTNRTLVGSDVIMFKHLTERRRKTKQNYVEHVMEQSYTRLGLNQSKITQKVEWGGVYPAPPHYDALAAHTKITWEWGLMTLHPVLHNK